MGQRGQEQPPIPRLRCTHTPRLCVSWELVHCWQWIVFIFFGNVWWVRGNQMLMVSHMMYILSIESLASVLGAI